MRSMSEPISFFASMASDLSQSRTGSLPWSLRKKRQPSFAVGLTYAVYRFRYACQRRLTRSSPHTDAGSPPPAEVMEAWGLGEEEYRERGPGV
jgi:hypothetical protein